MGDVFPSPVAVGEVADLLHAVERRLRIQRNAALSPFGVTPAQARALRMLSAGEGGVRMSELAERLRIARRSATSVVEELVTLGLVQRSADAADRRAVIVAVTSKGRRLLQRLGDSRRTALAALAEGFSPSEWDTLRTLLTRLAG
jgi:DNA-binding MarR family transcriptional regulator